MAGSKRRISPILGSVLALGLAIGWVVLPGSAGAAAPQLSTWDGGVSLYRAGTFTTQKSWLWCTAADVQIARNIVDHQTDHSKAGQQTYFRWMRLHNRYRLPLSAGVDPRGWAAGMRHFVDDRYRLVSSATFEGALRSAVTRLRLTGLPVALAVSHGNHGWLLTGFTATADPAVTTAFRVTSVRVVGPLYGLQSKNGYDMAPNTKLTPTQLRRYFTPWNYKPMKMIWDGRYVSIQPIPGRLGVTTTPTPAPTATPRPTPVPTARPTPVATAPRTPAAIATVRPTPRPAPTARLTPAPTKASPRPTTAPLAVAQADASVPPAYGGDPISDPAGLAVPAAAATTIDDVVAAISTVVAVASIGVLAAFAIVVVARRRTAPGRRSPSG